MKKFIVIGFSTLLIVVLYLNSADDKIQEESLIYKVNDINKVIRSLQKEFLEICHCLDLEPKVLLSIVYSELILNFDALDKFDNIRAKYGWDPSLGVCQIKLSTAKWLESRMSNIDSSISLSKDDTELQSKLNNDYINIYYGAIYINLIRGLFKNKYHTEADVSVLGSYYSKGIDVVYDVDSNYKNYLGKFAEKIYNSISMKKDPFFEIKENVNYYNYFMNVN